MNTHEPVRNTIKLISLSLSLSGVLLLTAGHVYAEDSQFTASNWVQHIHMSSIWPFGGVAVINKTLHVSNRITAAFGAGTI